MIVQEVITHLEALAPLAYAEEFDNVGLLVGDKNTKLTGVMVTLDTLEAVVDEAIENQCNLIISFHPIIFKGLKKITGKTYVERVLIKAIKHKIAIYAIHTALDNAFEGANAGLCELLGLKNKAILIPQAGTVKQLTTYVPEKMRMPSEQPCLRVVLGALEIIPTVVLAVLVQELIKEMNIQTPLLESNMFYKKFQKQESPLALRNI